MRLITLALGLLLCLASFFNTRIQASDQKILTQTHGNFRFLARVVKIYPEGDRAIVENINTREWIDVNLPRGLSDRMTELGRAVVSISEQPTLNRWEAIIEQPYLGIIEDVKGGYAVVNGREIKIINSHALAAGRRIVGRRAYGKIGITRTI